jgi:cytosine/adenosine deaminase-related metal-dependent hydrolase
LGAEPYTLAARWIFPVDQPPLAGGTITIQGERIVAVNKAGTRTADINLGNTAILPGFVNAHTHLDLSDALGRCPPGPDFTAWLRAVIEHRRRQTPADVDRAIGIGLAQCLRYGTTLVGDIAAGGVSWERLAGAPLRAVVFYELLGLGEERAALSLNQAKQWLNSLEPRSTSVPGLSPHAPYSAGARLFHDVAAFTHARGFRSDRPRVAIHLAETSAELHLLKEKSGPFVQFLSELGAWDPRGLVPDIQTILDHRFHGGGLFIHGNYLAPSAKLSGSLIYCPRTHAAFAHPPHPFREFLTGGTAVALGTDSLASNPDLDVLAEARFIHEKHPDLPGAILLRLATLAGATALGFHQETGSLSREKSADLIVLPLPNNDDAADPHRLFLESELPLEAVFFRGELRYATKKGELKLAQ